MEVHRWYATDQIDVRAIRFEIRLAIDDFAELEPFELEDAMSVQAA